MEFEIARIAKVVVETSIRAECAAVWQALTTEIGGWWPREFHTPGKEGARLVLEAHPGGRMFEQFREGEGILWGTVNTVLPRERLDVFGVAFPIFCGPALWTGSWELKVEGRETRVRFTEASFGMVSEAIMKEKEKGWKFLFDGVMRAHLEGRTPPKWDGPMTCGDGSS